MESISRYGSRSLNLPFKARVQVGYHYWHHFYLLGRARPDHRFVFQPFIVFDPPERPTVQGIALWLADKMQALVGRRPSLSRLAFGFEEGELL